MIRNLKPYPAYKDSGVPWLGDVPGHWEVPRLKQVCTRSALYGANVPASEYSADGIRFLRTTDIRDDGSLKPGGVHISPESATGYVLDDGDLLISRSGTIGRSFVYDNARHGPCAYAGYLVRFVLGARVVPTYVMYYTKTPAFADFLKLMSIQSTIENVNAEKYANSVLPLPSLPEQMAIVRYLDHADRKVRHVIRARQQLIKLLTEQKQAIIQRAVTRGLDPNVRLKPSGVPWLGDVPEHWEILPLKRWVSTKITDGPHETPPLMDDGIPFMSAESMVGGRFDFGHRRGFISRELHEVYCRKCRPQRDDIFMCKSGATTGKVSIVETDEEFSIWSPLALIRVSPQRILPRLLFSVLQSSYVQRQVHDTWSYGTQPNLAMEAMERLVIGLPPVNEQREILAHLEQETAPLAEAIDAAHREIDLLREYRTRLIADVVTGKLDVRNVPVPSDETDVLPEEPEDIDDPDAMDQGDDITEESA